MTHNAGGTACATFAQSQVGQAFSLPQASRRLSRRLAWLASAWDNRDMEAAGLDWGLILTNLERLAIAYALALPIGWEREKSERSAGLRTFPLVAVASCGFVLVAARAFTSADAMSRVLQGLIGGIGFIGGGAILQKTTSVHGTATAASIWNTGAIGASVALGRYEIAIILSVLNVATLLLLLPLKEATDRKRREEKPH